MTLDADEDDFTVVNWQADNSTLTVYVQHLPSNRTYMCQGRVGVDGCVEPLDPVGYRRKAKNLARSATLLAREFVDDETPYRMYDGEGAWWYTKTLRGLTYKEIQEFNKLSVAELRELQNKLRSDEIDLGSDGDE